MIIDIKNIFMKAGELLDIPVVEHIIVTEKSFFSFRVAGLIEIIRKDNKYALSFVYKKQMEQKMNALKASLKKEKRKIKLEGLREGKQKGEKIGLEKGAKKEKVEVARSLLLQGIDTKVIEKSTGLSRQWIGRLKSELDKKNNNTVIT